MVAIQNELLVLWTKIVTAAGEAELGTTEARTIALAAIGIVNA